MTFVSNINLLDTLRKTRLLGPDHLEAIAKQMAKRLVDARVVARALLQRGWLTVFQINQLLTGHGEDLVVGPYQVLDRLGQGGQSSVYKARHAHANLVVALKVIKGDILTNAEASRQFMQEMEAMATLQHPNVVQFFDADKYKDTYYCALEYVEGTDLGKYVRLAGSLPAAEACDYIRQAALGLQHAHERNLIHRDIKPGNLYLTAPRKRRGDPTPATAPLIKILDWGLASLSRPRAKLPNGGPPSTTKIVIGTADYLSPEQAINPDGVDIRGDIYSLGCAFYYLLTSQPPFAEGTMMQKILKHQNVDPVSVDMVRPDLPLGLAPILKRMIAKRPDDRYQTPAAVALALKPYCDPDRFLLPCLNREAHRLGLETELAPTPPLPTSVNDDGSSSTVGPHSNSHHAATPDTLHK